jgi:hypothetical protein
MKRGIKRSTIALKLHNCHPSINGTGLLIPVRVASSFE